MTERSKLRSVAHIARETAQMLQCTSGTDVESRDAERQRNVMAVDGTRHSPRTADNTTCHGCHLGSVQDRSPSPVHKLGTNFLHLLVTRSVSQL